jgi:hypothetical protein
MVITVHVSITPLHLRDAELIGAAPLSQEAVGVIQTPAKLKTCRLMGSRSPSWNWDREAPESRVSFCLFQIRARPGWCLASETTKLITLVRKKLSAMKVNKSGIICSISKYTYFLNVLFTIFHYHTDIHHHNMVHVTMHGC